MDALTTTAQARNPEDRPGFSDENLPLVSIVVCAYNDQDTIGAVVEGLINLDYPNKEVLVVNDYSTDATAAVVAGFPQVHLINNPHNLGLGGSMNAGLARARGEIIVYVQSDCVVSDPAWLDKMLAPFSDLKVGAVVSQRRVANWKELPLGAKLFDTVAPQALRNPWGEPREIDYFRDKADAYRRGVLTELGGFDSATFFTSGEDTDLSIKMRQAGYRIILSPDADLTYLFSSRQRSVAGGLKKALLYGSSAAILFHRHGYDGLRTRHFLLALASFLLSPWWILHPLSSFWGYLPVWVASLGVGVRVRPFSFRLPLAIISLLILAILAMGKGLLWPGDLGTSLMLTYGLFTLGMVWRSVAFACSQGAGAPLLALVLVYALAWRLLSGVGYLQGRLGSLVKGMAPKEQGAP